MEFAGAKGTALHLQQNRPSILKSFASVKEPTSNEQGQDLTKLLTARSSIDTHYPKLRSFTTQGIRFLVRKKK